MAINENLQSLPHHNVVFHLIPRRAYHNTVPSRFKFSSNFYPDLFAKHIQQEKLENDFYGFHLLVSCSVDGIIITL